MSKIEAGKIDLDIEPVSISRLVGDLERRFDLLAAEKKLDFSINVSPLCPRTIETDAQRVQQILSNLLSNALKFTEKGSVRLLVATNESGRIAFTVEDTGIGIPASQQEVIFRAFQQADGTTSRKFGGTGLGLSISREFAELLGGEIQVRSAPGEGSAFTLILPLRAQTVVAPPPPPSPREEAPPQQSAEVARPFVEDDRHSIMDSRRVVLIVEDDPVFAEILRDLAHELDFKCIIAGTADEGLRLARARRPEAIVLDVGLPDQSGLTVLELLKRDPSIRHAPIHIVSLHDYQQVAREMGAVGYALKPVKREQLLSAFRLLEDRLARETKAILLVEDESIQRGALTDLLASDNVRIVAVPTAEEALHRLRSMIFDCVILDLMLPGVSGFRTIGEDEHGGKQFASARDHLHGAFADRR